MTIAELENVDDETRYIIEAAAITHDIDHFIRVWAYARTIAELENVENFMVAWGTDYQRKNG